VKEQNNEEERKSASQNVIKGAILLECIVTLYWVLYTQHRHKHHT